MRMKLIRNPDTGKTIAIGAIVGAVGYGIYKWIVGQKPGYVAGDILIATFNFNYKGPADSYIFRIVIGYYHGIIPYFDEVPGTKQEITASLTATTAFTPKEVIVEYRVPELLSKGEYDVEASIRTYPDNKILIRYVTKGLVKVAE